MGNFEKRYDVCTVEYLGIHKISYFIVILKDKPSTLSIFALNLRHQFNSF